MAAYAMTEGNDRDALAILESIEGVEKKSAAHRFLYAFLCYRNDRFVDARHLIESVLEDDLFVARNPTVLYYAGRIAFYGGRFPEGMDYFERFDDALQSAKL